MSKFKPSKLTLALLSSGLLLNTPLYAQEANNDAPADDESEVLTITGIRGSLARAQALKMNENAIVEALSAEDIGKLPDTSIAESLARLPGVSGERRNGRTSGLSIRGLNENYIATSLNGRELLGMGDNRGVEYDLYPTEIVKEVVVYKTPQADVLNQGIGGTVDLRTISPLSAEPIMTVNATYEQNEKEAFNPDFDNDGLRLSFNYSDKFANDKLGLAIVIADQESTRQEVNSRIWGYPTSGVEPGAVVFGGHDSFIRSAELNRTSIAAVVEYAPNDKLRMQLDALYIDFEERDVRRGIEEAGPEWGGGNYTVTGVENGLVTSGFYDGFHSVVRNDGRTQDAELTTAAINIEYLISDSLTFEFDYSSGKVDKTITDIESYSGVGRAIVTDIDGDGVPDLVDNRPLSARSFQMTSRGVFFTPHPTVPFVDLSDPALIRLAGPQAWGGSLAPVTQYQGNEALGYPANTAQDGFVNEPVFDEDLDTLRLQFDGDAEWGIFSTFTAGLQWSDRTKEKINEGAYLTAPTWPNDGPVPPESVVGTTNLDVFGLGSIIAYDSIGLYNSGFYQEVAASGLETGRFGDTYTINEEVLTIFGQLNIDTEWGDVPVRGNLGLQFVDVDQSADGFGSLTGPDLFVEATPVSGGSSYSDVLPSLNLSFEVAEDQFIRTAMAKVVSRPRMDDMRPNNVVGFAFNDSRILDPDVGPWNGSAGNPELKPLEANQFDLSYENYYADDGFFAIGYFYKDLVNWHRDGAVLGDFTPFYIPGYHDATTGEPPATFLGPVTFREDGLEGKIEGYEFQASLPFSIMTESLDGLGLVFSATFLDGEFDPDENGDRAPIPGLSDENYSLTAYYERGGFEFRVSGTKRDDFETETRGLSLSLVPQGDLGSELWDMQIGYDFSESATGWLKGLRITLQGQNLTDEETIKANDDARQITEYQTYGANYLLSFNYDFR